MDDLISRQDAIVQLSHNKIGDDDCDVIIQNDIETIKALPSVERKTLTEADLIELRDRFGDYVEFVVRDMISGKGKREEKIDG